jgi:hypothetical protein
MNITINMTDPSASFDLRNIDIDTIYKLYPERLGVELQEILNVMGDEERREYYVNSKLRSAIIINHPEFGKYNELYLNLSEVLLAEDESVKEVSKVAYNAAIEALNSRITESIKREFSDAIFINETATTKLRPHIDTLLFVCLSFYNLHWDAFGDGFNGAIASNPLTNLEYEEQPHHYKSSKQLEFISNLLYSHYSKPASHKELSMIAGGREHITDDPQLVNWFVNLVTGAKLPLSLDYNGIILGKLLNHREQMEPKEFLIQLKKFTTLGAPDFTDMKRKVVKQYCLAVHKIFSYYMNLSEKTFTGKRLHIYHNILKSFKMDDFSTLRRKHEGENKRKVTPEDRLGDLLRSKP